MSIKEETFNIARVTHEAAADAAKLSMSTKSSILTEVARKNKGHEKKNPSQNQKLEGYKSTKSGLSTAMIDRLTLSDNVITQTVEGLDEIAAFPDPSEKSLECGLDRTACGSAK